MMKKNYVTPGLVLIPLAGVVGPNVGSPEKGDAEIQPELTPGDIEDLENGGGW